MGEEEKKIHHEGREGHEADPLKAWVGLCDLRDLL